VLVNSSLGGGLGIAITVAAGVATAKVAACPEVMQPPAAATAATTGSTFTLLESDDVVTVRILPDRSVADFFVQGGRWAATTAWASEAPRAPADSAVVVWAHAEGVTADVDVWGMGCGWANPSYTDHPTM
jgi:hypothetical protein